MQRRTFLLAAGTASLMRAATVKKTVTVLCDDRAVTLDKVRSEAKSPGDLWVQAADLPRINDFHLKPQGACRADTCIPIPKDMKNGEWFNLSAFARKVHQPVVSDSDVTRISWSARSIDDRCVLDDQIKHAECPLGPQRARTTRQFTAPRSRLLTAIDATLHSLRI